MFFKFKMNKLESELSFLGPSATSLSAIGGTALPGVSVAGDTASTALLLDLDKGLRSPHAADQCEAILAFLSFLRQLADGQPKGVAHKLSPDSVAVAVNSHALVLNSAVLKLADFFRVRYVVFIANVWILTVL